MKQGYLAQESKRTNEAARRTLIKSCIAFIILAVFLYVLLKSSLDVNDPSSQTIFSALKMLTGVFFFAFVAGLFRTSRVATNGRNLVLPFGEAEKAEVARIIDQEAAEGKIQVEEYIYDIPQGKRPHGEKIVLTPSYLVLFGDGSRVRAIPRDKIYWICAQVGQKGGPFIVQLQIYTEKKIFTMVGVDIEHVQNIAEKIYRYMPNVFCDYDPFILSYELEKLFAKNREEFLKFYENEKRKYEASQEFYASPDVS